MFKIGMRSGYQQMLTRIEVDFNTTRTITDVNGGLEDQIDADGGLRVSNYLSATVVSLGSAQGYGQPPTANAYKLVYNLTNSGGALSIPWANRYNYRLGFANIYAIGNIRLYADGNNSTPVETQTVNLGIGMFIGLIHCGINIDPANRLNTGSSQGSVLVPYPK